MKFPTLRSTIATLLCVVFVGVALQGVVSVLAEVHAGEAALLVKSWKEVLLGVIGVLLAIAVWRSGQWRKVARQKLLWLVAAIAFIHVVLFAVFDNDYVGEIAALLIDLRMYLLFVEVYVAVLLWPELRRTLTVAGIASMGIIASFALLQATVLPRDVLAPLGYSKATIQPYLTVDLNDDFVRINSTLRGPNPLGAVAVMAISIGAAVILRRVPMRRWQKNALWGGVAASVVALWSSYSRSAWLGVFAAIVVLAVAVGVRRIPKHIALGVLAAAVLLLGVTLALKDTPLVQNVVFHTNPDSPTVHKSDDGHLDSLRHGTEAMLSQPLGAGLGSTGSASLLTEEPVIIENQYFYMAHESGWLGLGLQLWLFGWVLVLLWQERLRVLGLGLFAAGIGLGVIGLVLPVWADDTVALLWWGLAGVAVAGVGHGLPKRKLE
jgi:predicted aspartyl protease